MYLETCQEGIEITYKLLEISDVKSSSERTETCVKIGAEFLEMIFHAHAFTKDFKAQAEVA